MARYVGSEACQSCHEAEYADWEGSHHDRAMMVADDTTILGNFDTTFVSQVSPQGFTCATAGTLPIQKAPMVSIMTMKSSTHLESSHCSSISWSFPKELFSASVRPGTPTRAYGLIYIRI
jgi:hypothetical protein